MDHPDVRSIARKAIRSDYEDWLVMFFSAGGKPTHYYKYPWGGSGSWYFVPKHMSCDIPALWGADSISVIIEKGAAVRVSTVRSHNELYLYPAGTTEKGFIPIYNDLNIPGFSDLVENLRQKDGRERQEFEEQQRRRDEERQEEASKMIPL